jgi:chromosome segregation ATPase
VHELDAELATVKRNAKEVELSLESKVQRIADLEISMDRRVRQLEDEASAAQRRLQECRDESALTQRRLQEAADDLRAVAATSATRFQHLEEESDRRVKLIEDAFATKAAQVDELKTASTAQARRVGELEEQLLKEELLLKEAMHCNEGAARRVAELEEDATAKTASHGALQAAHGALQAAFDEKIAELLALAAALQQQKVEASALDAKHGTLHAAHTELREQCERVRLELEQSDRERAALLKRADDLAGQVTAHELDLAANDLALADLTEQLAHARSESQAAPCTRCAVLDAQIAELEALVAKLQATVDGMPPLIAPDPSPPRPRRRDSNVGFDLEAFVRDVPIYIDDLVPKARADDVRRLCFMLIDEHRVPIKLTFRYYLARSMYKTERVDFTLSSNQLRALMKDIRCSAECVAQIGFITKQAKQSRHRGTFGSQFSAADPHCLSMCEYVEALVRISHIHFSKKAGWSIERARAAFVFARARAHAHRRTHARTHTCTH